FLNARQTLDFYARIFNMNRAQRVRAVEYYLDFVGLDPSVRRRRLKTYSKGQARRVGLAQALINDPDLVILDEPTSGLDPLGTQEMKNLIKELKRAGKTVLLSSHQLADVEDVCDRVCILYRGKLEVEGTVDSLLEVQDVFKVEARNVPAEVQQQVVSMLQHSAGVSEVQPGVQRSRLQDLFNRLVLNKRAAERAAK
ncbi:MAG TPA: ABC transporter ATP-binding protein, partial [Phycisphaerae bacterium]|nr:ABC transporter ATP-binding protein [Phycisphaerae bacterium]